MMLHSTTLDTRGELSRLTFTDWSSDKCVFRSSADHFSKKG